MDERRVTVREFFRGLARVIAFGVALSACLLGTGAVISAVAILLGSFGDMADLGLALVIAVACYLVASYGERFAMGRDGRRALRTPDEWWPR
jgi:hypothetical protein